MKHLRLSLSMLLLLFILPASLILAQDETEAALGYGSPVTGMIDDSSSRNVWSFEVTSLDRVSIIVERTSGNLLPDLIVRDPNGDEVGQSYGPDNTGAVAVIDDLDFERTGTYQILVQRQNFEDGLTSGEYTLTLNLLASGEESSINAEPIGPIEYNTFIEDRITPEHWLHRYTLDAPAADFIQVSASRNAGTLMPEVEVRDSDDNSLRVGYIENTGDFATLNFDLPQAGQYTVIITRDRRYDGETSGTYRLTLDLVGAGEGNPLLDQTMGNVEYGAAIIGELADGQWYQDWVLTAEAGDVITIIEQRPLDAASGTGNLRPEVALLDSNAQELRRGYVDYTGAEAIIDRYALDAPGEYIVRASRERGQNGLTNGSYVLTVILNGSGPGSPSLQESSGIVEIGSIVEGEITDAQWLNAWEITADSEQSIDIRVDRTSGTLIPQIDIQDSNGQSVRTVYADQTQASAEVTDYHFPAAATYRIVVLRDRNESGYTSGSYQLSVLATPDE